MCTRRVHVACARDMWRVHAQVGRLAEDKARVESEHLEPEGRGIEQGESELEAKQRRQRPQLLVPRPREREHVGADDGHIEQAGALQSLRLHTLRDRVDGELRAGSLLEQRGLERLAKGAKRRAHLRRQPRDVGRLERLGIARCGRRAKVRRRRAQRLLLA